MISLMFNIDQLKPHIVIIQETKFTRKSQAKIEGYRSFPTVRGDSGGGVLIACLPSLDPVEIFEGDSECEVLVMQIKVGNNPMRIIVGYGPQECAPLVVRETY